MRAMGTSSPLRLTGEMRGGRCWYVVESKSFEILVGLFGGKLKGKISDRSRETSLWIRFGEWIFGCLLEGIEACHRDESGKVWSKNWVEDGREFRLEVHSLLF